MIRPWPALFALFFFVATPVLAQDVRLTGANGATTVFTAAEIAALPRQSLSLSSHGQTHVYEGPTLASVLERVDAPLGEQLRGPALTTYIVARAADGYAVVLSLAEIDPAMSQNLVILADRVDGAALPADDGPLRLVVGGDARPARSARQVVAIEVRAP